MTTATLEEPKIKDEPREYLCGLSPLSPKAFIEVPVQINKGEKDARPRWKTIQFAFNTTHYTSDQDVTGFPRFGRVESMTQSDIEQVWDYLSHRVVRWMGGGRKADDRLHPTIEGSRPDGYGPNQAFSTGKVFDKRDIRYVPNANDEPLEKYVVLRPLRAEDRGAVSRDIPLEGGKDYYKAQLAATLSKVTVDAKEAAAQQQRIVELEAMVKALEERVRLQEDAKASESIDKEEDKGRRGKRR